MSDDLARFWRGVALAAAAGAFFTVAGVFGTGEIRLPLRLAYWEAVMIGGGLWAALCSRATRKIAGLASRVWLHGSLLTVILAVPLTGFVWGMTRLIFGTHWSLATLPHMFWPVLVICAAMTALNLLLDRRPVETHAAAAGGPAPRFPDRLPPRLRGAAIRAVEAEDHYLRVHTDRGSDLILMRLSDAVAELEGLEGAQTHRSWWVAKAAVRGARRGDGRATLLLEGGVEAPVSRSYARALRAAGWY